MSSLPFCVIAGPCSIESYEVLTQVARTIQDLGVTALRGGIYKMRTNPESFQGLGESAYSIVAQVKQELGLSLVSEVTDVRQIKGLSEVADVLQVGTRNMYNYELLKELGKQEKPVLLKRGLSAYLEEWLQAANYVIQGGNSRVMLCERGIRTFERETRNTLDLAAVPILKSKVNYPILVDPSHGTGRKDLVLPMALAAAAAGADGLLIEVHPNPEKALSDGAQALDLFELEDLMKRLRTLLPALGRRLSDPGIPFFSSL